MYLKYLEILFAVALVLSIIGFKNYIWFMSIGYGLAVAGIGVTIIHFSSHHIACVALWLCFLLIVYGLRLALYLIYREVKSASYKKTLQANFENPNKMPVFVKAAIWLCVSLLYVAQCAPVLYRVLEKTTIYRTGLIGIVIAIVGVVIETVADIQKSKHKKFSPHDPVMQGLYKFVRCPNYFGEILFWTGIFVSGLEVYSNTFQWIISIVGYILIVYVMFNGATRLEKRQNKNYGDRVDYKDYVRLTPIILPFIPLYTLNKGKKNG